MAALSGALSGAVGLSVALTSSAALSASLTPSSGLSGALSRGGALSAGLSASATLSAALSVPAVRGDIKTYAGEYAVTPSSSEQQLETANRYMKQDVTVHSIPYYETSNLSGGYTVYIGSV